MAKFEIQRAPERLRTTGATGVRWSGSVDTGAQAIGRAAVGFGGAISDLGVKMDLIEADNQLAEKTREANRISNEINDLVRQTEDTDAETFDAIYEDIATRITDLRPSNPTAARAFDRRLAVLLPENEELIADARISKIETAFGAENKALLNDVKAGGSLEKYLIHLQKGKKLNVRGFQTDEELKPLKQIGIATATQAAILNAIIGDDLAKAGTLLAQADPLALTPRQVLGLKNAIKTGQRVLQDKADQAAQEVLLKRIKGLSSEEAFDIIDADTTIPFNKKGAVRQEFSVRNSIMRAEKAQAEKDAQIETARNLLLSLWAGNLTDTSLREATKAGMMEYGKAKGLREALANPKPFNISAYIKVKDALLSYKRGRTSFDDALTVLMANASMLGNHGKGLTDKLYEMPNKTEADWEDEGADYIQSQILEKDLLGNIWGTPKEQTAALEARLAFDVALETAERKGEPIEGRDKLIKAHEIMVKYRLIKDEEPPIELEKGLGTIPLINESDIDKALKQAKENLGENPTPQQIKEEALRLLR